MASADGHKSHEARSFRRPKWLRVVLEEVGQRGELEFGWKSPLSENEYVSTFRTHTQHGAVILLKVFYAQFQSVSLRTIVFFSVRVSSLNERV